MSIEIKIGLGDADVSAAMLEQHMAALGFTRRAPTMAVTAVEAPRRETSSHASGTASEMIARAEQAAGSMTDEQRQQIEDNRAKAIAEQSAAPEPKRERGKPSAGRARRTREEIAEDEAAERSEQEAAGEPAAISTGENRAGPEDEPEVQEQDRADEQAEAEAAKAARVEKTGKVLTHDDVRTALGTYVTKYGMAAAQQDGPKLIAKVCGDGKVKISDIPDDQEVLGKVVAGVQEMLEKNPFGREAV